MNGEEAARATVPPPFAWAAAVRVLRVDSRSIHPVFSGVGVVRGGRPPTEGGPVVVLNKGIHMVRKHAVSIVRVLAACWAAAFVLHAVACHTVEGAGKDVQNAGAAVEDTARDSR
jgi:predicted small secreted protein